MHHLREPIGSRHFGERAARARTPRQSSRDDRKHVGCNTAQVDLCVTETGRTTPARPVLLLPPT